MLFFTRTCPERAWGSEEMKRGLCPLEGVWSSARETQSRS